MPTVPLTFSMPDVALPGTQPLYGAPVWSLYWNSIVLSGRLRITWKVFRPPVLQNFTESYSTMNVSFVALVQ